MFLIPFTFGEYCKVDKVKTDGITHRTGVKLSSGGELDILSDSCTSRPGSGRSYVELEFGSLLSLSIVTELMNDTQSGTSFIKVRLIEYIWSGVGLHP